ncbi:MAG: PrsW family intramembrane metalloprotease [Candidatus Aminicenantes bacterium]|nr:PrsW family intramembrane metalloprotease [Candidatus Aminicenantes bacterium]
MTIGLIIAAIISPAIFWIFYFRYKDRFSPEPVSIMGGAFMIGFASGHIYLKFISFLSGVGIPADQSYFIFNGSLVSLVYLIFVVGFFEELFKLFSFIFIVKWFRNFDEKIDGIIYSSIVALGFAAYENFMYLPYLSGAELIGRAIASPLTHSVFASIWGHYTGILILNKNKNYKKVLIVFTISFFLHGIYDYLSLSSTLRILSSLVILLIWVWRIRVLEIETKRLMPEL